MDVIDISSTDSENEIEFESVSHVKPSSDMGFGTNNLQLATFDFGNNGMIQNNAIRTVDTPKYQNEMEDLNFTSDSETDEFNNNSMPIEEEGDLFHFTLDEIVNIKEPKPSSQPYENMPTLPDFSQAHLHNDVEDQQKDFSILSSGNNNSPFFQHNDSRILPASLQPSVSRHLGGVSDKIKREVEQIQYFHERSNGSGLASTSQKKNVEDISDDDDDLLIYESNGFKKIPSTSYESRHLPLSWAHGKSGNERQYTSFQPVDLNGFRECPRVGEQMHGQHDERMVFQVALQVFPQSHRYLGILRVHNRIPFR